MMTIEGFAVFRGKLSIPTSVSYAMEEAIAYMQMMYRLGYDKHLTVRPVCWSAERGEFIAVPDSISI